jgi:thiol-disulfide isomerase/thioredoxin
MMGAALLAFRLGLACVFAVAGAAKLADRKGARKAAVDFGAPEALAGPLAVALPLAELAVAVLLLPAGTARWGALGALGLLAIFSAAIVLALARGRAPDCHCFGQLHSEPAGWKTLGRNAGLAGLAVFVAVGGWSDPGPGALAWIGGLEGTGILALVVGTVGVAVVAVGGWALVQGMRAYGRVLLRLERVEHALAGAGLSIGEPEEEMPAIGQTPGSEAPAFSLRDIRGRAVTLDGLLGRERPLLLLFTSPTCGPCATLMPSVVDWQREHDDALTIALVTSGDPETVRDEAVRQGLARVLIDEELAVYHDYEANGTPSAVVVSADGYIASWVASGPEWIERLVSRTLDEPDDGAAFEDEGLPVGEPAPPLVLPDLDGRQVELADLRGAEIALLFWNPDCGFCRAMHEQLLAWEAHPPADAPQLVVVCGGESEAAAKEGFGSRVLLDAEFTAGGAFAAGGTPMAVRIDADGNVASPLVAGTAAVFSLLGANGASGPDS